MLQEPIEPRPTYLEYRYEKAVDDMGQFKIPTLAEVGWQKIKKLTPHLNRMIQSITIERGSILPVIL